MGGINHKQAANPREWHSWNNMKQRCDNPNATGYANYGGRGIGYCSDWASFDNFLIDMGLRDAGESLDRIDPNKDYSPSNCRWTTKTEQQRNRREHSNAEVGVTFDKSRNKWQAGINVNNKRIASRFKTKEEAIEWRVRKERELWKKERV